MNLKIVYPLSVSRVNQDGSPYEFTENRFFDQTKLFVDYQRIDSGYVAKDDDNYYLIPDEAGIEINPEMHKFGNPDINEAYKRTENVSDYTKAYAAFGKDRSLDYSAQIDKDLLDTNTENILGVSLVKVDENYQPTQVMPSVIGPGEQKIPTNNALLKETLDLIRSHIANKSNAHAIESIVGLSSSLNQLVESISSVNTIANNSLEIAEGAATTAGEAVQSINEHASSTTNPHPTNVTQEFADTQITPLATEATYTTSVWAYLVGLFTSVPKSVKEHIVKIWGVVNNLAVRIGLLEDKYILKYVVPVDTTAINLTQDRYGNAFNFEEGTTLQICFRVNAFVGEQANNINIRFNNNSNAIYAWATIRTTSFQMMGASYNGGSCIFTFTVTNKEIDAFWKSNIKSSSTSFNGQQFYKGCTTALNADILTKITLSVVDTRYPIPAGTVILIKKI